MTNPKLCLGQSSAGPCSLNTSWINTYPLIIFGFLGLSLRVNNKMIFPNNNPRVRNILLRSTLFGSTISVTSQFPAWIMNTQRIVKLRCRKCTQGSKRLLRDYREQSVSFRQTVASLDGSSPTYLTMAWLGNFHFKLSSLIKDIWNDIAIMNSDEIHVRYENPGPFLVINL